jgi:hypothetical protein
MAWRGQFGQQSSRKLELKIIFGSGKSLRSLSGLSNLSVKIALSKFILENTVENG